MLDEIHRHQLPPSHSIYAVVQVTSKAETAEGRKRQELHDRTGRPAVLMDLLAVQGGSQGGAHLQQRHLQACREPQVLCLAKCRVVARAIAANRCGRRAFVSGRRHCSKPLWKALVP